MNILKLKILFTVLVTSLLSNYSHAGWDDTLKIISSRLKALPQMSICTLKYETAGINTTSIFCDTPTNRNVVLCDYLTGCVFTGSSNNVLIRFEKDLNNALMYSGFTWIREQQLSDDGDRQNIFQKK